MPKKIKKQRKLSGAEINIVVAEGVNEDTLKKLRGEIEKASEDPTYILLTNYPVYIQKISLK